MHQYLRLAFIAAGISTILAIDTTNCNTTKSCVINPHGCSPTHPKCLVFTYSFNSVKNVINMELSGGIGSGKEYVGVAFSLDGLMQNSDLYYCTGTELKSGVIQKHYNVPVTNSKLPKNITNVKASTTNGVAMCTFTRTLNVAKNVSGNVINFDLAKSQYYVLQAFGNITNGTIHKHPGKDVGRFSTGPYNFTTPLPAKVTTTTASQTTTHSPSGNLPAYCGKTKGCFISPSDCIPGNSGCVFCSWTYDAKLEVFDFEIIAGKSGEYAAIAFGTTNAMQDADLYYCTDTQFFSGAIVQKHKQPTVYSHLPKGVTHIHTVVVDGMINCKFQRPSNVSKTLSSGANHNFDLAKSKYYLLFAVGPASKNGSISYHGKTRAISQSRLNFTDHNVNISSLNINLVKVHACLMIIAWVMCTNVGVFISRHFKLMWKNRSTSKKKLWFQLHRGFMLTALLFTLVGFVVIFVAKMGYSSAAGVHPILGIVVTALVIINPIMAACRPSPDAVKRPLFNWFHAFVGSLARIFSASTMLFGLNLPLIGLPQWLTWLLIGFLIFHLCTEMLLEVVSANYGHISIYYWPLQWGWIAFTWNQSACSDAWETNMSISYMSFSKRETIEIDREPLIDLKVPGEFTKNAILATYTVINLTTVTILIYFIAAS